jgi:hypothetical protein
MSLIDFNSHKYWKNSPNNFNPEIGPKGCEWQITYRHWQKGGNILYVNYIYNYRTGLTAFEAWQKSIFPYSPAFHQCVCTQLMSFPCEKKDNTTITRNT